MSNKYLTPSVSELYRAPRMGDTDPMHDPMHRGILSTLNARIDFLHHQNKIGESVALQIFNTARRTVIEQITEN